MKKLVILVFVLLCVAPNSINAQTQTKITFTYEDVNGKEQTIIGEGYVENIPCCEIYGDGKYENQSDWVHIPIYWKSGRGSGVIDWFGPGDETVGGSGLYDFVMRILEAM